MSVDNALSRNARVQGPRAASEAAWRILRHGAVAAFARSELRAPWRGRMVHGFPGAVCPRKTSRIGRGAVSHYSGLLGIRPTTDRKTKSETERHSTRRPTRTHACVYCVACVRVRVRVRTCMRMCVHRAPPEEGSACARACVRACANVCECVHWTEGATERGGGGRPYPKQKTRRGEQQQEQQRQRQSAEQQPCRHGEEQPEQQSSRCSVRAAGAAARRSQCILAGASAAHLFTARRCEETPFPVHPRGRERRPLWRRRAGRAEREGSLRGELAERREGGAVGA